jgi:predicted dehydrogenase
VDIARTYRVALIGYGYAGRTFHAPLIAATPRLELAVVASRDAGKVHADLPEVEVVADPLRAVDDGRIDLVVIASPSDSHTPLAQAALEAGKHVVVDKPFTLTLAQARGLAALATRHGRLLSVFHNRRWDSDYLSVRRAVEDGLIGEVVHFESHFDRFRPEVRARWRERAGAGGGLWFDLGPHLVDQTLQLFGLPERINAEIATQRAGGEADDWAHVVLDYGAKRAILHGSMLVAGGSARFTVHGTRGSVVKSRIDRQETQLLRGLRPGDAGWGEDDDPLLLYDGSDAPPRRIAATAGDQCRYYIAIRDALDGRGDNPVTQLQAVAVMAVLETAVEAARDGCARRLPLSVEERAAWIAAAREQH